MFRPMRRKQKELGMAEAVQLLRAERRGVLAVNGDDGYPYAIPVNYLYNEETQTITFHGARAGHKADALKNCDKVCFTVFGHECVKDEELWAPWLQSVVIFGRCRPVADQDACIAMVRTLAMKYYPDAQTVEEEIAQSGRAVQMYEITIEHMTAKQIQEK